MKTECEQRQFERVYNKFMDQHGVYTKVTDDKGKLFGYLLRCELPVEHAPENTVFVGFSFVATAPRNVMFNKTVGMNSCMVHGIRHMQKLMENGQINTLNEYMGVPLDTMFEKSYPINGAFGYVNNLDNIVYVTNMTEDKFIGEDIDMYISNEFDFNQFYEYMIAFERKAKKYYKEKRVVPVWSIANNTTIMEF